MITIDIANTIFIGCLAVGGILLLVSVLLGDVMGGLFDWLNVDLDLGGVSLLPILLGFVAMFGVGGLFGTEGLGWEAAPASLLGAGTGAVGSLVVFVVFRGLRSAEAPGATRSDSLIGQVGRVTVGIAARGYGTVLVDFDGAPMQRRATADQDIPTGRRIRVVSIVGGDLVVAPADDA